MKELQPINENVLLEVLESKGEQKTASGIIIPESAKEKETIGKVIAIGDIKKPGIVAGDNVLYKKFSGTELNFEGRKYIVMPYEDILVKIVETEEI